MNKRKKILIGSIGCFLLISSIIILVALKHNKSNCNINAIQFKKEYEKYNGQQIMYQNKKYKLRSLDIDENNPMKKLKQDNIIDKLQSKTAVIFFSSPINYTSREMLSVLLEVAPSFDCDVIYYYDIDELTDENIKSEITNTIKEQLDNFESLDNGNILFILNGEIVEAQIGISKDYKYGKAINETQRNTLSRSLKNGFNSINGGMCERQQQC